MNNFNRKPLLDLERTGKRIKELRAINRISVRDLQDYLGYDRPQVIYNWENGKNMPSIDNLLAMSSLFGVSINEIVVSDEDDETEEVFPYQAKCHLSLIG